MSEENGPEAGKEEFKPITSQDDLNRLIGERIARERAKFADYDDLKAKAAKVDEAEAAKKSEIEKATERIAALEAGIRLAEQTSLRTRIAAETGVIPEVLTGDSEEEMRAAAQRVIAWRDSGKRTPPPPKSLKSGSGSESSHEGERGRAAAALREMRRTGT